MGRKRSDEFQKDAVRIALTCGLTRKHRAGDLGIGMSTLNTWVTAHRDTDVMSNEDLRLAQESERLRRENRILKEEREILKTVLGCGPPVRGRNSLCYCQRRSKNLQVGRSKTRPLGLNFSALSFALIEPVAFAVHLQDVHVMGEPVEERAGQALRAEGFRPFLERQVAGDQRRAPFVVL